jgi:hypothetical protein
MKITELAALVQVRNHILTVLNDKSVTNRDEFRPLNDIRLKLDKKFVEIVKDLDVDCIFQNQLTLVKVGDSSYTPSPKDLECWRDFFDQSQKDSDFKIFTHSPVSVTQLEVDPKGKVQVVPAAEPRTIEVSPNISITTSLDESSVKDIDNQISLPIETNVSTDNCIQNVVDVKIESAVVEDVAKPILIPKEVKKEVAEKARKAKQKAASEDPDISEAIQRQKEELKKQGRSNKKVNKE